MKITSPAKKFWESIPNEVRMKLLNNVWCGDCSDVVNIKAEKMSVEKKMLKIEGKCMNCGGEVCRMVES